MEFDLEDLIALVLEGVSASRVISYAVEGTLDEYIQGTIRRPRKQRFRGRGPAVSAKTGKRKDPRRRLIARRTARRFAAKRKAAARRLGRTPQKRMMMKKLSKLHSR